MSGPSAVLFVCNLNRVRSPMAAALLRRRCAPSIRVESCGLEPADSVDPFVVAALHELGLDLSEHEPKAFEEVERPFDLVIALTPEAHRHASELARGRGVDIEYWDVSDPTLVEGTRDQRLEAYRATREELERRISERFDA